MRDQFIKSTVSTVNNNNPKITVHNGHFSSLPVPDGWADLIVIAQVGVHIGTLQRFPYC